MKISNSILRHWKATPNKVLSNTIRQLSTIDIREPYASKQISDNKLVQNRDTLRYDGVHHGAIVQLRSLSVSHGHGRSYFTQNGIFNTRLQINTSESSRSCLIGLTSSRPLSSSSARFTTDSHNPGVEAILNSTPSTNKLPNVDQTDLNSVNDIANELSTDVIASGHLEAVASTAVEPTFSSLGLAHGWPSGYMQSLLETIYMNADMGWSGTIILATVLLRVCVFPIMLHARKKMIHANHHMPEFQQHQYNIHIATTKQELALATRKFKEFRIEKRISMSAQFVPPMCSGLLLSTMFFALRGMANCPVESMATGGMGWFVDLTVMDPYFILPVLTASTLAINMKIGMDAADTSQTPPQLMTLMKFGLPIMTLVFTCTFPSALCLYWFTSNVISVVQGAILRAPAIKKVLNLGDFKKWSEKDLPMTNVSIFQQAASIQDPSKMHDSSHKAQNFDSLGIEDAIRQAESKAESFLKKKNNRN